MKIPAGAIALFTVVGFAFGLVTGMLWWRTKAVQTEQWKVFQQETARVRDTCLDSLMWERQRHKEIEEFHGRSK